MRTILSLDGGGIRGIIPSMVLAYIEEQCGAPVIEQFDLITGTSTGGIIALALTRPGEEPDRPQFLARDLVGLYEKRGPEIFHTPMRQKFSSLFGLLDEKYSATSLERVLYDYLGEARLGSALRKVLISSYDLNLREPFFFKSWRPEHAAIRMRDAARATSAAPTYFEPALIDAGGGSRPLVDGGVFINNPAMSGYVEARRLFPDDNDVVVVALGTGIATRPIQHKDAKNWGLAGWARPVLDVVFDGVSDAVDYQLGHLLEDSYFRFQTDLAIAKHALGDASPANLDALKLEAENLIKRNQSRLEQLCERLKQPR